MSTHPSEGFLGSQFPDSNRKERLMVQMPSTQHLDEFCKASFSIPGCLTRPLVVVVYL